jgi:DNA-binding IclR family transcriptional regulator
MRFETSGARSESVRQANLTAVLRILHLGGTATLSELVAATGLTRSAIGALVGELGLLGFVTAGRPSRALRAGAAQAAVGWATGSTVPSWCT